MIQICRMLRVLTPGMCACVCVFVCVFVCVRAHGCWGGGRGWVSRQRESEVGWQWGRVLVEIAGWGPDLSPHSHGQKSGSSCSVSASRSRLQAYQRSDTQHTPERQTDTHTHRQILPSVIPQVEASGSVSGCLLPAPCSLGCEGHWRGLL